MFRYFFALPHKGNSNEKVADTFVWRNKEIVYQFSFVFALLVQSAVFRSLELITAVVKNIMRQVQFLYGRLIMFSSRISSFNHYEYKKVAELKYYGYGLEHFSILTKKKQTLSGNYIQMFWVMAFLKAFQNNDV